MSIISGIFYLKDSPPDLSEYPEVTLGERVENRQAFVLDTSSDQAARHTLDELEKLPQISNISIVIFLSEALT